MMIPMIRQMIVPNPHFVPNPHHLDPYAMDDIRSLDHTHLLNHLFPLICNTKWTMIEIMRKMC